MATTARKSAVAEATATESLVGALASVPLFADLSRAELAPLAGVTSAKGLRGGVLVVREGEQADTMYFVLSGRLKVYVAGAEGREIRLATLGPGQYFGDMALDDGLRSASVMTLQPCRLATLSRDAFRDFLRRQPDVSLALIRSLIRRTRAMNERVRDLTMVDVAGRVAKLLLSLAQEADGRWVVDERLTQQEIADRVGASREMVSRVLKELRSDGTIRDEGRRIVVLRRPLRG